MKAMQTPLPLPNRSLLDILGAAYRPCANFGLCREAQWNPQRGHIPRGFLGATGTPEEVEVIMVFAEPGHPYEGHGFDPALGPDGILQGGVQQTYDCFRNMTDQFHANVRWFMGQLYPALSFDDQLRHVWLTEGRLCSIDNEIGNARDRTCATHYLKRQIAALPNATVIAFGGKAQHYLKGLDIDRIDAFALSPPGANQKAARPSWIAAIEAVRARRSTRRV